jgi:L-ascorbate metabolism protein UlaG (beta-lactamase superfamily)
MLRPLAALLAGLMVACPAGAASKARKVTIIWHGQSFFEIKANDGFTIVTDPHAIDAYMPIKGVKAHVIIASHRHSDHVQFQTVENFKEKLSKKWPKARVIQGLKAMGVREDWDKINEKLDNGRIRLRSVASYHDNVQGMKRGKNTIFLIMVDGINLCFLGDLGQEKLTKEQLKEIGPVDVLFIPVGGVYTLNGSDAQDVVKQIKPKKYIIPMHYGTDVFEDLLPIREFLDGQDRSTIARAPENKLVVNVKYKPKKPIIAVLKWKGRKDRSE